MFGLCIGYKQCLAHRARTISSNEESTHDELEQLQNVFDYPPGLTNKCLHSKSRQKPTEDEERPPTLNTPYIKGFSEKLERACRPLKIRTTFSSKRTLRTELVHVKGQIMVDKQKGVVYRVNCNTCNQTYIGETGRTLKV